jgi:hypothetical protein
MFVAVCSMRGAGGWLGAARSGTSFRVALCGMCVFAANRTCISAVWFGERVIRSVMHWKLCDPSSWVA